MRVWNIVSRSLIPSDIRSAKLIPVYRQHLYLSNVKIHGIINSDSCTIGKEEIVMKRVEIFTDGACSGNPGPGGYGVILRYNGTVKELSGGERETTNNRMELTAVITGLSALKEPCEVELYSDSKYIIDAVTKGWAKKWQSNGWIKGDKKKALNSDLWERLLALLDKHRVTFIWVKGHARHSENERCDRLAVEAAQSMKK